MIQAFVGLVGGGKSFCSVRRMCAYMAAGGRCASNILLSGWDEKTGDLSPDSPVIPFLASLGWRYQPKQYVYISYDDMVSNPLWYERIPQGESRDRRTLCVVDEATDLFDTLDGGKLRNDSGYRQLFHFLRLSRHAHIDVLFVCQDISTINSRLRALVANVWRSTDMRHFKIGIFKLGFPFDVFMLQLFDRTGKFEIKREFVRKDQRIFGLYKSETFGGCLGVKWDGVAVDNEKGKITKDKKELPKMTLPWKIAFIALLLGFCWLGYRDIRRPSAASLAPSFEALTNEINKAVASLDLRGYGGNHSPHYYQITNQLPQVKDKAQAGSRVSPTSDKPKTAGAPSLPKDKIVRGSFEFGSCGSDNLWVWFDGALYRKGYPSEFGRVILIDKYMVACISDDGVTTYLLPLDDTKLPRDLLPSPRFTSSGDGRSSRGGSWYYAHTGTNEER